MNRMSMNQRFASCPACKKDIMVRLTIDVDEAAISASPLMPMDGIDLKGKVSGAFIQHDCTPRETRGNGPRVDQINYIMLAVEAPPGTPVHEIIEQFCDKQGWRVLDDSEIPDEEDED